MTPISLQLGEWRASAECRKAPDNKIFDAAENEKNNNNPYLKPRVIEALSYCARCPVALECKADAESDVFYPASGVRAGRYISKREATEVMRKARERLGYEPVFPKQWVAAERTGGNDE